MASANRLLAALPSAEFERIAPELEVVELRRREATWSTGEEVRHVYFPESGGVAVVAGTAGGSVLEIGLVGQEGLVGVEPFFGAAAACASALVLLPGVAQRLPASAFNRLCVPGTAFYESVRRYAAARLAVISQSAACDATHSIHHRCVRRLLMLHDAARADDFPITQQVLATLLGVRRASVSVAAEKLQEMRLIRYEHGRMHVTDRAGLERAACGCYERIRAQTQNLFGLQAEKTPGPVQVGQG